ncbi:hypothetical protein ACHAXA_001652 [Cyclostephanos tholiformis]|uniref:Uncharacterized protein n=1 Tax=Cyclostephanos tholiformis TaxID=382380 RepID=A0ABD3RVD4_9STRA
MLQCDQLGLSSIRDKSKSIPKCFGSRDSETVDNANSVEDDFESPIKDTVVENASSQDREQSVNKVEQLTQPVLKSAAPDHENLQEEISVSSQSQGEHEDQYIVVIVAKPLDAHTTPDKQSNSKGKKNCGAVCLPTDAQYQEEAKESLHFEHTERSASSVPRSFAKTKSMKLKNAGCMLSAKKEPARQSHYSLERLAQLSKPTERRSDDYYKTTHKPKKTSIDPSEGGPNFADFLERMESKEAERRERAQRAAAKALYDAKVDKNCGAIQSFEEMYKGKIECNKDGCRGEKNCYVSHKKFKLKRFEERMKRSAQRRSLILDRIEEERKLKILSTTQKMSHRQKELKETVSQEHFNIRTANDIRKRSEKLANLEQTAREMLEKEHSFKPNLNVAEHLIKNRQGGLDHLAQPSRRYTDEYQPPYDEIEQMLEKSRRRKKPLDSHK